MRLVYEKPMVVIDLYVADTSLASVCVTNCVDYSKYDATCEGEKVTNHPLDGGRVHNCNVNYGLIPGSEAYCD